VSGEELRVLAEEQAALRRVATLVARGVPPDEVFAAVTLEVVRLLPVDFARMGRYESDGTLTFVAQWRDVGTLLAVGSRHPLGGHNLGTLVFEFGRPARLDDYADSSSGPLGAGIRAAGLRSAVGTPVIVEGRLWGVVVAGSISEQPLAPDTEARLASFTELVATAIAAINGLSATSADPASTTSRVRSARSTRGEPSSSAREACATSVSRSVTTRLTTSACVTAPLPGSARSAPPGWSIPSRGR